MVLKKVLRSVSVGVRRFQADLGLFQEVSVEFKGISEGFREVVIVVPVGLSSVASDF